MSRQSPLALAGTSLLADLSGALIWPERRLVAVADLHLEKGSAAAARGRLLPPYDTARTLARLEAVIGQAGARTVLCLGDSVHDAGAAGRIAPADLARIRSLTASLDWVWITGNHDPEPPDWGGRIADAVTIGPLVFRHIATEVAGRDITAEAAGEVSGHLHPAAALDTRGRRLHGRCFVDNGQRLVLPAFGAYAGGLDVFDPAIVGLFPTGFHIHLIGRDRIHRLPDHRLARRLPYLPLARAAGESGSRQ